MHLIHVRNILLDPQRNSNYIQMSNKKKSAAEILRQKAEDELINRYNSLETKDLNIDFLQLTHELQVHQVELMLQNEELSKLNIESELARRKFTDLYDFAPSGYFTLDREGEILQLNLCASKMIGKERSLLIHSRLGFFISDDTKSYFRNFLHNIFKYDIFEYWEITFVGKDGVPMFVQLNGTLTEDGEYCLITAVNITERKKAEMAVLENERFLLETQMIAKLGSFSIDIERGVWVGSVVLNLIFGIDDQYDKSLSGWMEIIHPQWRQQLKEAFYVSVDSQSMFDVEYKIIRRSDRLERWMHVLGHIEINQSGVPVSIKGTIIDITDRKEAQLSFNESQRLYADLVANQSAGFYRLRVEKPQEDKSIYEFTSFEFVSDRFCKLFGITNSGNLNHIIQDIFLHIHPDYFELFTQSHTTAIQLMLPYCIEIKVITDDGFRWVSVEATPRLVENGASIWTGIVRDITAQKYSEELIRISEEKYRMLLDLASDAFFHGDSEGNFITVNSLATEYTGFSKEELLTMNMKDLFSEKTLKNSPLKLAHAQLGETVMTERELVRKDGKTILVEMKSKMMPDGTYQSFVSDVTEKKRIENALKQKLLEMEIYYELAVTRERKMISLKGEVNLLLTRLGEGLKY